MTRATKRKASVPRASSRDGACACSRGVNVASGAAVPTRADGDARCARGRDRGRDGREAVVGDG